MYDSNDSSKYVRNVSERDGTSGDDRITIKNFNSIVYGGAGNDTIYNNWGDDSSIFGGEGDDLISLKAGTHRNTISGDEGNDTIYGNKDLTNSANATTYLYANGDGYDVIYNLTKYDTINITTGKYSKTTVGSNIVLNAWNGNSNNGAITLVGAARLSKINVVGDEKKNEWKISGTTAKYGTSEKTLVTVTGVKSVEGLNIDEDNKIVTVAETSLNKNTVTISDGYKLALADSVETPSTTKAKWTKSGTTAKYISAKTTEGYKLSSDTKSITYTKAGGGNQVVKITGLKNTSSTAGISLKAGVVTVKSSAMADNKKVSVSGSNYRFNITGTAGRNTIIGGVNADTLNGGSGDDVLTGGKGADLFVYTAGDDKITDFSAADTLRIGNGKGTYSVNESGNDIIITVGDSKITLAGAAKLSKLNIEGVEKNPEIVFEDNKVTLTADYSKNKFTLTNSYSSVVTVDASAVTHNISITGNKLSNMIVATEGNDYIDGGAGNDTIIGGAGNDTLKGGKGADIFVYSKGDGNDNILDYSESDIVSIKGDTVQKVTESGENLILNLASKKKITVTGGKDKILHFTDDLGEHKYDSSVVIKNFVKFTKKSATIKSDYPLESFEPIYYSQYASSLVTIDSSAVQHGMNIIANNNANRIFGTNEDDCIDGGKGTDTIMSYAGNDYIKGGDGNDYIIGGEGNDTLWGGKGNDDLYGNEGVDVFLYSKGDGDDTIFDYDYEMDKIILLSGTVENAEIKDNDLVFTMEDKSKLTIHDFAQTPNAYAKIFDSSGKKVLKEYPISR